MHYLNSRFTSVELSCVDPLLALSGNWVLRVWIHCFTISGNWVRMSIHCLIVLFGNLVLRVWIHCLIVLSGNWVRVWIDCFHCPVIWVLCGTFQGKIRVCSGHVGGKFQGKCNIFLVALRRVLLWKNQ